MNENLLNPVVTGRMKVHAKSSCLAMILVFLWEARAGNLLPDASFADGASQAAGWSLVGNGGPVAVSSAGPVALVVEGNGNDESYWHSEEIDLACIFHNSFDF